MGKWSAFLISLIPAGLAGYLCYLLVTIGLPAAEEIGTMFWAPLGAGFLACVMCLLAPVGIAIFVPSAPKTQAVEKPTDAADDDDDWDDEDDLETADSSMLSGDVEEFDDDDDGEDDLSANDFASDDDIDVSSDFESVELSADELSNDEFDIFEDDEFDSKKS